MGYLYLGIAIVAEVVATTLLKATDGFTRPLPTVAALAIYALAFYMLALTVRSVPVGLAYAIWAGAGIVLIALLGWAVYRQALDLPALAGMALICAGIVVITVFSKSAGP